MNTVVDLNDAYDYLEFAYGKRDEIVLCLSGVPGIGKTEIIDRFAKEKGVDVCEIILSQTLPTEISGIKMPDPETKKMEVFDDVRLANLKDGDILLFDELFEAPHQVMSACLTLIQSRRMLSGRKLPDVMIVACTNPTLGVASLKQSFKERFFFINVNANVYSWIKYCYDNLGVIPAKRIFNKVQDYCSNSSRDSSYDSIWNAPSPRSMYKLLAMVDSVVNNEHGIDMINISKLEGMLSAMDIGGVYPSDFIQSVTELKKVDDGSFADTIVPKLVSKLTEKSSKDRNYLSAIYDLYHYDNATWLKRYCTNVGEFSGFNLRILLADVLADLEIEVKKSDDPIISKLFEDEGEENVQTEDSES